MNSAAYQRLGCIAFLTLAVLASTFGNAQPTSADSFGQSPARWEDFFCIGAEVCRTGDFDGDDRDDIIAFVRNSWSGASGNVYVALSDGGRFGQPMLWQGNLCLGDEVCDSGDFNGDGRDDAIAFARDNRSGDARGDVYVGLSITANYRPYTVHLPLLLH